MTKSMTLASTPSRPFEMNFILRATLNFMNGPLSFVSVISYLSTFLNIHFNVACTSSAQIFAPRNYAL